MSEIEYAFPIGVYDTGQRLDRAVSRRMNVSLRAARRLIELKLVRVDAHPRPAGYKLYSGQTVTIAARAILSPPCSAPSDLHAAGEPYVVAATADYIAIFKPSGLHTVSLAGATEPTLEAELPRLFPRQSVILVNRLDRDTSGLVLGVFDVQTVQYFRDLEAQGLVDKRYLAVVTREILGPMTLKWALDTADRVKVKVLDAPTPDALRWTLVQPLGRVAGGTLVEARIVKGARHQIRAHLAHAGFPISGDALYGADEARTELKLHHWRVTFPGFCAEIRPGWQDVDALRA